MDPRRVLTFRAVAHARSFTAAGRELALTQPAVSQQVAGLEAELGAPLLVREPGGLRLTRAGTVLLAHADVVAERLGLAGAQIADLAHAEDARLRIGGFSSSLAVLVPELVERLRQASPDAEVLVQEGDSAALAGRVLAGELHMSLAFQDAELPRREHEGLERRDVLREPFLVAVHREHPLAGRDTVELAELAGDRWSAASTDGLIAHACERAGFVPRIVSIARDPIAIREFVARGIAVTLVPRLLAPGLAGLAFLTIAGDAPQRDVYALLPPGWPASARRGRALRPHRSSLRAGVNGRLLITCPDRHGIVAAVAGFLADSGANIISSDQHSTDPEGGEFFMRMEFTLAHGDLSSLGQAFAQEVAERLDMRWRLTDAGYPKRVGVLVSREDHCLVDLLWRHRRGELDAEIALVASNHPDHRADVEGFGIAYYHVPVAPGAKTESEARLLELLRDVDLVVLARYMQILSGDFLTALGGPGDQHPPLVPAGFRGREPVSARVRTRREDHRRDRALRDRGARRGADHRAGRRPRLAPRAPRDDGAPGPRHRAHRAVARGQVAPRGPGARARQPHRRVLAQPSTTSASSGPTSRRERRETPASSTRW